ncbi:hypothetical protein BO70DRAFT_397968 [Aspergillus heteromorphus CBS 117.55]|uniref:Fungal lipase-type domain-containing protein n=1 Tax=Aspergillus heteromorphus CBS 117.55 TaxID=1448321 RepID=A0A317VYV9_9EURO|nr:uncharacterized protein BO70DRAFT_397968 [Aspergillus heteromorphus CBS 117.55]PWY77080.1 hypothetical protein BO70DRAFT_397968 [Aspergillus heteromorphus CBS 117.55]
MRRLWKLPKAHRESALRTSSPPPPPSAFAFIHGNSQGASAAVAELSGILGAALEQMDLDGDLDVQIKALTARLDEEASTYDNSQLGHEQSKNGWTCSQEHARLISIAWKCADDSYNAISITSPLAFEDYTFTRDHITTPSIDDGTVKAVAFTIVDRAGLSGNGLFPLLVVAVRGTGNAIDHMVDVNSTPRNADIFIDASRLRHEDPSSGTVLLAHSEFLQSAIALESIVSDRLSSYARQSGTQRCHVLFTGHAAGGAVASLLYLRYISRERSVFSMRFSCVTFGAPPTVTLPMMGKEMASDLPSELCLNIINECDIASRADKPFILCLVNLLRSLYDQPPISMDDAAYSYPAFEVSGTGHNWPVPHSIFSHVGPRVILSTQLNDTQEDSMHLRAAMVSRAEFEKLLFCRVSVHQRKSYANRVKMIAKGLYNGLPVPDAVK